MAVLSLLLNAHATSFWLLSHRPSRLSTAVVIPVRVATTDRSYGSATVRNAGKAYLVDASFFCLFHGTVRASENP